MLGTDLVQMNWIDDFSKDHILRNTDLVFNLVRKNYEIYDSCCLGYLILRVNFIFQNE